MHNMISLWYLNTWKETEKAAAQAAIEDMLNHGWDPQFGVSLISTQLLKLLSWSLENGVSDLYDFLLFFSEKLCKKGLRLYSACCCMVYTQTRLKAKIKIQYPEQRLHSVLGNYFHFVLCFSGKIIINYDPYLW